MNLASDLRGANARLHITNAANRRCRTTRLYLYGMICQKAEQCYVFPTTRMSDADPPSAFSGPSRETYHADPRFQPPKFRHHLQDVPDLTPDAGEVACSSNLKSCMQVSRRSEAPDEKRIQDVALDDCMNPSRSRSSLRVTTRMTTDALQHRLTFRLADRSATRS